MSWTILEPAWLHRAICKTCHIVLSGTNAEDLGRRMDDHQTGCGQW
jgi:hypothetical protein